MPVVAVIQHAGAALGGIDEEQKRQAKQAEPLGGFLDGEARGRLGLMVTGSSNGPSCSAGRVSLALVGSPSSLLGRGHWRMPVPFSVKRWNS